MRNLKIALAGVVASSLALVGCGGSETTSGDTTTSPATSQSGGADGEETTHLTVGASAVPHAQILEYVRDNLAADAGLELEIVEFDDYVTPNSSLADGSLDANYFQHLPYLEAQIADQGYDFEHGEGIHIEPYALFSTKYQSVDDLPDGATIAVTNDPSNQYRALKVLEEAGLLNDITEDSTVITLTDEQNPKGLTFEENNPEIIVQLYQDPAIDAAMINGNFILSAGLNTDDAIAAEKVEGNPYSNILVWQAGSEKIDAITKLDELLHSEDVANYIKETWPSGDVIPGS